MSKHTKGPWIADGAQIFTSDTNVAQANGYRIDRETVAANARLIAAAPELLALARLLLRGLDSGNVKAKPIIEMDDDAPMVQMQSLASIARAAIAKATGENT